MVFRVRSVRRLGPPRSKDPLAADGPTALDELPDLLEAEFGLATSSAARDCDSTANSSRSPRLRLQASAMRSAASNCVVSS